MMTQLESAKKNNLTPLMKKISDAEGIPAQELLRKVKEGKIVIPANASRQLKKPCGIGAGLRVKINANLGTSTDIVDMENEISKLKVAVEFGADTVMDLSVGGDLQEIRKRIVKASVVPVGTVPVYEVAVKAQSEHGDALKFSGEDVFSVLESQAKDGVDFFTIHAGINKRSIRVLKKTKRLLGVVSRGGALLAAWMERSGKENPLYEQFDRVLDIAYRYDITLSLGDGLRPGSVLDSTDAPQRAELAVLGELVKRCRSRNVQVMVEGPGHVPLNHIRLNVELEKKTCHGAPFYVLGPLITDIAPGYDHIVGAAGGAMAALYGADFLCYVTPAEHLRHPSLDDVREGVIASRIAAHAADIALGNKQALEWDRAISEARKKRDWRNQIRLSVNPKKAEEFRFSSQPNMSDVCTMCGNFCSIKMMEQCAKAKKKK